MAKKKNTDDLYTILTFEQADTHLARMGQLETERVVAESAAQLKIDAAKDELKAACKLIDAKISKHKKSLKVFCNKNKSDFGSQRSRTLMFGALGWRRGTSIRIAKTTLEKILDVFKKTKDRYLHIKMTPDKEALAKLTDEQLRQVDAKRIVKNEFFAEPDLTECGGYGYNP